MDAAAAFRSSRLNLLEFYASPSEQLEWQNRAPGLGIDEPLEWWLEDFHPESELFTSAFSPHEISKLREFNRLFESASTNYPGPPYPRVEVALKDPAWLQVIAAAERLRGELNET